MGSGKFASHSLMREATVASGSQILTVALRRVDLTRAGAGDILDFIAAGHHAAAQHGRGRRR